MKRITKTTNLLAALMLLPASLVNAEMLYEANTLNTSCGTVSATTWPSLNAQRILVDDISVPASGWTINKISEYLDPFGSPIVGKFYLIVFPKSLGLIDPNDYKTEVPVTTTIDTLTDSNTGITWEKLYRFNAADLNLQLSAGDYWIGLSPIAADFDVNWMVCGSRTTNGERAIFYNNEAGTIGWGYPFWNGHDLMMRIEGTPGTAISTTEATPGSVTLMQNYPNPFNPATTINFELKSAGSVKLSVFNAAGKMVSELVNGSLTAGIHNVEFNAANLNSGTYFYKLQTAGVTQTKKMLLIK